MLGILVALIKIAELATVDPGIGMYAFGALVLLIPAIMVNFDARELWQRVEWTGSRRPMQPRRVTNDAPAARRPRVVREPATCCRVRPAGRSRASARAAASNSNSAATASIETTWALVVAAAICYIPANVLPVLEHHHTGGFRGRHHHGRGGISLYVGIVAAGARGADRERDDSAWASWSRSPTC